MPVLLDEAADVRSVCPVTGDDIRLSVTGDGSLRGVTPPTTVVAVAGADITSCCTTTGPNSDVCTEMPFLYAAAVSSRS